MSNTCDLCHRGKEACQYCENLPERDWRAICDCGLYDFGAHLVACLEHENYRYVVAMDHGAAVLPR